jgi:acyl phosphate:glycerol-3-phosphate acyltransferase
VSGALTLLLAAIGAIMIAYLLGSIPTGYLTGKVLRGIDIREHGSRSTGATNVLRTLGKGPAAVVLAIDIAKGAAAVGFAQWLTAQLSLEGSAWIVALAGLAALLGHARSVWLRFSGGKSAATGLGVLLALSWPVGFGAAMVFGVTLAFVRIVSLGSILAALTAMVLGLALGLPVPYLLLLAAGGIYVIVRHRANMARLLNGTEPRLGQKSLETGPRDQGG